MPSNTTRFYVPVFHDPLHTSVLGRVLGREKRGSQQVRAAADSVSSRGAAGATASAIMECCIALADHQPPKFQIARRGGLCGTDYTIRANRDADVEIWGEVR